MQPPQGLVEKVKGLGKLKRLADSMPKSVRAGSCQEIVLDEPDLDALPIQHCWPGDPAPFITLPAVITKDPRSGVRNVGMYRMQKIDARTTYAASAPLPKHIDELLLAGFLRGEPVELVKAKTVDLEVPASADIVLEGYVEAGELG